MWITRCREFSHIPTAQQQQPYSLRNPMVDPKRTCTQCCVQSRTIPLSVICSLEKHANVLAKSKGTVPVDLTVPLAVSIIVQAKPSTAGLDGFRKYPLSHQNPRSVIGGIAVDTTTAPVMGECPGGPKTDLSGLRTITHCQERIFIRYHPSQVCPHHWRLENISYAGSFYNSGSA